MVQRPRKVLLQGMRMALPLGRRTTAAGNATCPRRNAASRPLTAACSPTKSARNG